jgi:cephalosporin-C deacetylase-like acetyl esterase
MTLSRRRFLETTATLAAAASFGRSVAVAQQAPNRQGAPGVDLNIDTAALPDYSRDLEQYLVRLANEAHDRRKQIINGISTRQGVLDRQKTVVSELWKMLGGPLDRTPLNARVIGTIERPGYRIEKLTFESRPRLYVTANLYVPTGPGRRPGILGPLGHSVNGKAWPSYQKLFTNLARKGYVVLAYDPFGQGERIEYPGSRPGQSALGGGTSEHEYAGRRLILLGANFGLFRAWDGIRGIDYLLTRPEVDPDRIGCCGQSGGGTLTQFLAALDNRIRVAVVSMGNTENLAEADVEPPGSADDAEQNIVPALARGIDRADLLYAFAPRPLLMGITLHDAGHTYSPEYVSGSLEFLDEYKRAYGLLGANDRVALQATTVAHGYVYEMRRATYAWFNRWFEMKNADDGETSQSVEPESTLYATPTGFVTTSLGGETALSLTRQMADEIHAPSSPSAADVRTRVRSVLAIEPSPEGAPVTARILATIKKPGYRAEQFEFTSEREIRTPGWMLTPDSAGTATPTVLYIGDAAAWSAIAEDAFAERLCARGGCRVAVIDVRGRGDCAIAYPQRGRFYFPGRIADEAYLTWFTLMLGKPLVGGQVYDALRALEYLRSRADVGSDGAISIVGDGAHGVIGLYAAALDVRVRRLIMRQTVTDYRSLSVAERYTQPFGVYAYGVLREFDLPDVAGSLESRPVLLINPVNARGEAAGTEAQDRYKAIPNVRVRTLDAAEDAVTTMSSWLAGR